jgi:hypothetical protein
MAREAVRRVRRDERPDLQDDLIAIAELERARIDAQAHAVQVDANRAAEAEQPGRREPAAPDGEDLPKSRAAREAEHACGVERPHVRAAARIRDATRRRSDALEPDPGRDDDDAAVREELEMRTRAVAERCRVARSVRGRTRPVLRPRSDRRRYDRRHVAHGIAALIVLVLAGCGGGSSGGGEITVQPARQYTLSFTAKPQAPGKPTHLVLRIVQPDGKPLAAYKRGSGPHTGVHLIYVRRDLSVLVHHHPPVRADGTIVDDVTFPAAGPYRVVVDAYPAEPKPLPNFQLFTQLRVPGKYIQQPIAEPTPSNGYRITLAPHKPLRAVTPGFLNFTVTRGDGTPARFSPWYGALAHAIFFRAGTLDYFHTHVCAPGAVGCTSTFGGAKVTGTSATPGKLDVGVLVPVSGTWRLFLQFRADGKVLSEPFTLQVR